MIWLDNMQINASSMGGTGCALAQAAQARAPDPRPYCALSRCRYCLKLSAEKARLERSRYVHSTVRNRLPRRTAKLGRWLPEASHAERGAGRAKGPRPCFLPASTGSNAGAQGYDGVVRLLYCLSCVNLRPTKTHALSGGGLTLWPTAPQRSGKSGADDELPAAARDSARGATQGNLTPWP